MSPGVDLSDILDILRRRLGTILLVLALFLLPAIVYIMVAPTLYSATNSILVDPRQGRSLSVDTAISLSADTSALESQLKLVMSQTVLRRVVETEKLTTDPEFGPQPPGLISRVFSVLRRTPPEPSQQDRIDIAVDALAKNISVRRSERTYVIDIQASSLDAQKSARLANAVAKAYLEDASEARGDVVRLESTYVRDQLNDLQTKMQEAEQRVAVFKEKNRIFDANGKLVNDEQITNLSTEIVQARTKTAEAKARVDQVQRALRAGRNIETLADAPRFPVLERLRTQAAEIARAEANLRTTLGPRHPQLLEVQQQAADTRNQIMNELRRLAVAADNEYQVAKQSEASLEAELARLRTIAETTNLALPQLRELERNVDAQRAAFDKLSKAGDTISQQGADTPVARVIAVALVPVAPSSPRRIPILALAATAGLCFGMGAALLAESLSRRRLAPVRPLYRVADENRTLTARRARRSFGLGATIAALGGWLRRRTARSGKADVAAPARSDARVSAAIIPSLDRRAMQSPLSAARDDPGSAFAAAIRALASAELGRSRALAGPAFVLVTSVEPGVGKSVLVSNLAEVAAAAGARILVIDANTENPTLSIDASGHAVLGRIMAMGRMRQAFAYEANGEGGYVFLLPASEGDEATAERLQRTLQPLLVGDIDQNFDLVLIDAAAIKAGGEHLLSESADRILLVGAGEIADPASLSMAAQALRVSLDKLTPIVIEIEGSRSI